MKRGISYLLYLLSQDSRVLLEKLTGSQLVKEFPAFHGTRPFITTFTSARHLSLPWASSIQSTPPHPTSWRSILILSSQLNLNIIKDLPPNWIISFLEVYKELMHCFIVFPVFSQVSYHLYFSKLLWLER